MADMPDEIWANPRWHYYFEHRQQTDLVSYLKRTPARANAGPMLEALKEVVADIEEYQRVWNLSPSPGKSDCWQSVTQAKAIIAAAEGRGENDAG